MKYIKLEPKKIKFKKDKDMIKYAKKYVKKDGEIIEATNKRGRTIHIKNPSKTEAHRDILTLNGYEVTLGNTK